MKISICQLLDDYLDHDLDPVERSQFIAHLSECSSCRQAIAEQERLESLLAEANARLEPSPVGLVIQIEECLRQNRRRRWVVVAAAVAATAAAICLVCRTPLRPGPSEFPVTEPVAESNSPQLPQPSLSVRVSFPHDANVFAVREKSDSPNVTIVHVYSGLLSSPGSAKRISLDMERSNE